MDKANILVCIYQYQWFSWGSTQRIKILFSILLICMLEHSFIFIKYHYYGVCLFLKVVEQENDVNWGFWSGLSTQFSLTQAFFFFPSVVYFMGMAIQDPFFICCFTFRGKKFPSVLPFWYCSTKLSTLHLQLPRFSSRWYKVAKHVFVERT